MLIFIFLIQQAAGPASDPAGGSHPGLMFLQTVAALGFVAGLAWLMLRVLLPRTVGQASLSRFSLSSSTAGLMRQHDQLRLQDRRTIHLVEIAGRYFAILASESGSQIVAELEPEAVAAATEKVRADAAVGGAAGNVVDLFKQSFDHLSAKWWRKETSGQRLDR